MNHEKKKECDCPAPDKANCYICRPYRQMMQAEWLKGQKKVVQQDKIGRLGFSQLLNVGMLFEMFSLRKDFVSIKRLYKIILKRE